MYSKKLLYRIYKYGFSILLMSWCHLVFPTFEIISSLKSKCIQIEKSNNEYVNTNNPTRSNILSEAIKMIRFKKSCFLNRFKTQHIGVSDKSVLVNRIMLMISKKKNKKILLIRADKSNVRVFIHNLEYYNKMDS